MTCNVFDVYFRYSETGTLGFISEKPGVAANTLHAEYAADQRNGNAFDYAHELLPTFRPVILMREAGRDGGGLYDDMRELLFEWI